MLKTCSHIFLHCETSLSVLRTHETNFSPKPAKNPVKTGKNQSKTGQKAVKFSEPYPVTGPNNFYYWTFLIISKTLFRPILAEPAELEQI